MAKKDKAGSGRKEAEKDMEGSDRKVDEKAENTKEEREKMCVRQFEDAVEGEVSGAKILWKRWWKAPS